MGSDAQQVAVVGSDAQQVAIVVEGCKLMYLLLVVLVIGIAVGVWISHRFRPSVGSERTEKVPEKVFVALRGDCFHHFSCQHLRKAGQIREGTRELRRCTKCWE